MPTYQPYMFPVLVVGLLGALGAWPAQSIRVAEDDANGEVAARSGPGDGGHDPAPKPKVAARNGPGDGGHDPAPKPKAAADAARASGALAAAEAERGHGDGQESCQEWIPLDQVMARFGDEGAELLRQLPHSNATECGNATPAVQAAYPPECTANFLDDSDSNHPRYLDLGMEQLEKDGYVKVGDNWCFSRADLISNRGPPLFDAMRNPLTLEDFESMQTLMKDQQFWPNALPGESLNSGSSLQETKDQMLLCEKVFGTQQQIRRMHSDRWFDIVVPRLRNRCSGGAVALDIFAYLLPYARPEQITVVEDRATEQEFSAHILATFKDRPNSRDLAHVQEKVQRFFGTAYNDVIAFINGWLFTKNAKVQFDGPGWTKEMVFSIEKDGRQDAVSLRWECNKPRISLLKRVKLVGRRCGGAGLELLLRFAGGCARPSASDDA